MSAIVATDTLIPVSVPEGTPPGQPESPARVSHCARPGTGGEREADGAMLVEGVGETDGVADGEGGVRRGCCDCQVSASAALTLAGSKLNTSKTAAETAASVEAATMTHELFTTLPERGPTRRRGW